MPVLEVVVRPRVFPDIRPKDVKDARNDNPGEGRAVIQGQGGQVIDLGYSYQSSTRKQRNTEVKRTFDVARVKQVRDDGTINENNFVDVEIPHRMQLRLGDGSQFKVRWRKPVVEDYPNGNIEIREQDIVRENKDQL